MFNIPLWKKYVEENQLFSRHGSATMALLGTVVGVAFGLGAGLAFASDSLGPLGWYLMFLGFFHLSEFVCVALFNPKLLSAESFLLNHSFEFNLAMAASFVEYFVELYYFPGLKTFWPVTYLGVLGSLVGQGVRLAALVTAGHNFTHDIAETKRAEHRLVTEGIYTYVRHPGYFGWFWWSVFTQVVLLNPICIAGFAAAAWKFFQERIAYEETILMEFFGDQYRAFKSKTPTGIPGIQ